MKPNAPLIIRAKRFKTVLRKIKTLTFVSGFILFSAEEEGFEPPLRLTVKQFSRLPLSTALPLLRYKNSQWILISFKNIFFYPVSPNTCFKKKLSLSRL